MDLLRKITGKTIIEGHRGAEGLGVENSWQAIERGYKSGADFLELDLQISGDGTIALFNDYLLPDGRWLKDTIASDLKKLEVKGQKIVFLQDVLEWLIDKTVCLSLDIKNGFGLDRGLFINVLNLVEKYHLINKVMFLSWDHAGLLELKERNPIVTTRALIRGVPVNFVEILQRARVDAVNLSTDLATFEIVKSVQKMGIAAFLSMTYRPDFSLVEKWKVDGISCKDPGAARRAIESLT